MSGHSDSSRTDGASHASMLRLMRGHCFWLLWAILLLMIAYPYLMPSLIGKITLNVVNLAILAAAVFAVSRSRKSLLAAVVLAVPCASLQWYVVVTDDHTAFRALALSEVLFLGFALVNLLLYVLRGDDVTADKIHAAVSVYLLLALFFATVYFFIEHERPSSFAFDAAREPEGRLDVYDMIYFSVVTMTSTGYGDIVPVSTPARSIANLQQLIGVFYVAILIARLAGLYPPRGARRLDRSG